MKTQVNWLEYGKNLITNTKVMSFVSSFHIADGITSRNLKVLAEDSSLSGMSAWSNIYKCLFRIEIA